MSNIHRITSRAEMTKILEDVYLNKMSVKEAFDIIDLTIRCVHSDTADWLQKKADQLRETP